MDKNSIPKIPKSYLVQSPSMITPSKLQNEPKNEKDPNLKTKLIL